jgi:TRAP-type C4-dicarboxylate transport system substrate-binding protein
VNKAAFAALPADLQAAVRAAAGRAETRGWKMSEELNETYKRTLAQRGITVLPPTETMKAELKRIGETMAAEWAQRAGADGAAVIAAFRR